MSRCSVLKAEATTAAAEALRVFDSLESVFDDDRSRVSGTLTKLVQESSRFVGDSDAELGEANDDVSELVSAAVKQAGVHPMLLFRHIPHYDNCLPSDVYCQASKRSVLQMHAKV